MDCSPPGSSVHGIIQARTLEWVGVSFSRGSSPPRDQTHISCLAGRFFTTESPGKPIFHLLSTCIHKLSQSYHLSSGYYLSVTYLLSTLMYHLSVPVACLSTRHVSVLCLCVTYLPVVHPYVSSLCTCRLSLHPSRVYPLSVYHLSVCHPGVIVVEPRSMSLTHSGANLKHQSLEQRKVHCGTKEGEWGLVFRRLRSGIHLAVQWLGLQASTKIPHAPQCSQKQKKDLESLMSFREEVFLGKIWGRTAVCVTLP